VGAHEPTALGADFYGAEHFFRKQKKYFLAIPMRRKERLGQEARRLRLGKLLRGLHIEPPSTSYVGFVPSRVDFQWKGQDRLLEGLRALRASGKAKNIHFIFAGWGSDFERARQRVLEWGISHQVTFLPCALSKPLLFDFASSADFVVDQFVVGMTGTSALEAMACASPVMMWVNDTVERPWGQPPVIQARTARDIERKLDDISAGRLDLERIGREQQEWVCRLHDPAKVTRGLQDRFAEAIAA
jgi:glycosyltransferase involved in cell wall biosynthesis